MLRVGQFLYLLAACHDVQANQVTAKPSSTTTTAFFATPPASLGVPADFTAGPFFATDFLKAFFPGFGPSQTSVEPQPLITDPVVSVFDKYKFQTCSKWTWFEVQNCLPAWSYWSRNYSYSKSSGSCGTSSIWNNQLPDCHLTFHQPVHSELNPIPPECFHPNHRNPQQHREDL